MHILTYILDRSLDGSIHQGDEVLLHLHNPGELHAECSRVQEADIGGVSASVRKKSRYTRANGPNYSCK